MAFGVPPSQHPDNRPQLPERRGARQPGANDEVRAPTLLAVRQLRAQNLGEAIFGHPLPAHHPSALQPERRGYDKDTVDPIGAPRLEQQGDVEHDQPFATGAGAGDKPALGGADHRMENGFEPAPSLAVRKNPRTKPAPIDPAALVTDAGKCGVDGDDRSSPGSHQPVDFGIGIEQRHAQAAQRRRGIAFAHADRPGEAEDDHRTPASVVRTAARSSRVTRTGLPNQASKPGLPWCSSMPSPSTVRSPRRLAAARSPVSSGT